LARAHHHACVTRGLYGLDTIKRVARPMSDLIYAMMLRREHPVRTATVMLL
jgi:hypothetical protein